MRAQPPARRSDGSLGGSRRASLALPWGLVLLATAVLGGLNAWDAWRMAPSWGQDLAFFHQLVHAAASGERWASPLLLEPQGFWQMVHTHLVLPLVVGVYALWPDQRVLLLFQGAFAGLALWPAYRLAETVAIERDHPRPWLPATLAALSLLLLGPFHAAGTCDFRPSVLFLPGILGVFDAARRGRPVQLLAWALVANLGRQEAPYLLAAAGVGLTLLPWGGHGLGLGPRAWIGRVRWQHGLLLLCAAALAFTLWVIAKPQMFFHFDPTRLSAPASLAPEHLADRWDFAWRAARSGLSLGLLSPTALVSGLPLYAQMARDGREWTDLVGATAHYHAPWLAFAAASAVAGAMRWPLRAGGPVVGAALLCALNLLAWPLPAPREGPYPWRALAQAVPPEARVAADYDTIHAVAGRAVLWNAAQLLQPEAERPLAFEGRWPLTLDDVDVVLVDADTELARVALAQGWQEAAGVEVEGRRKLRLEAPASRAEAARQAADEARRAAPPVRATERGPFHPAGEVTLQVEPGPGGFLLSGDDAGGGRLGPALPLPCGPVPVGVVAVVPAQLDADAEREVAVVLACAGAPGARGELRTAVVEWRDARFATMPAWDARLAGAADVAAVRRALDADR